MHRTAFAPLAALTPAFIITAAAASPGATPPAAAPSYSLTTIQHSPTTKNTEALAFGPKGEVLGTYGSSLWHAFIADIDGTIMSLHTLPASWISTPRDMNSSGQVLLDVGIPPAGDGAYTPVPYRYTPGIGLEPLTTNLPNNSASLFEMFIDDAGNIGANFWGTTFSAAIYTDASGWRLVKDLMAGDGFYRITDLTPDGTLIIHEQGNDNTMWHVNIATGEATEVFTLEGVSNLNAVIANGSGVIAGNFAASQTQWCAFTADLASFTNLHPLRFDSASWSSAHAIASNGNVAGSVNSWPGHSLFITTAEGTSIVEFKDSEGVTAHAINAAGEAIFSLFEAPTYSFTGFAAAADGTITELQSIVDGLAPGAYFEVKPIDLDDAGRILATAHTAPGFGGTMVTLILTPTAPCPTDLTADGATDSADLNIVLAAFGCSSGAGVPPACAGDLNGDGLTTSADLNILLTSFGATCN